MKRAILLVAVISAACATPEEFPVVGEINIIPQPHSIERIGGVFEINRETVICASSEVESRAAEFLSEALMTRSNVNISVVGECGRKNTIAFVTDEAVTDPKLDSEYRLRIAPEGVRIAGSGRGMFYAVQSLIQQIPAGAVAPIQLPGAEIYDKPRFEYRGMHLDVARHFMPPEFIKTYIDHISRYKFNYFHWHLTDDQGWRVEIKQRPNLTEIGSKRNESALSKADEPYRGDGKPVEGFYTQDEIRDIVEYARRRYVTIIPEIEMPGHSAAALAAYPELGCRGKDYPYKVKTAWGAFPDVMCPSETTFTFVEIVLGELIDLFPDSPYIHIGGDEVQYTEQWTASAAVRQLKAAEGLKNDVSVTSYFLRRASKFLTSRGKTPIGWDEVLDGGADQDMVVMAWQDQERGIRAATLGHKVIMAPWRNTYFDHPPGESEPGRIALGDPVTIEDVYRFDPVPNGMPTRTAANILGGQGCVWTEFIKTEEDVEYMMLPRALALAEALWSARERKHLANFYQRLAIELVQLDKQSIKFWIPRPNGFKDRRLGATERAIVDLGPIFGGTKIFYTRDGTKPDFAAIPYGAPFILDVPDKSEVRIRAITVMPSGRTGTEYAATFSRGDVRPKMQAFQPPVYHQSNSARLPAEIVSTAPPAVKSSAVPSPSPTPAQPRQKVNSNSEN